MKISTLCYIENGNDVLLLHRTKKKNDENAGKWIGVGGKLEDGEAPSECLVREVYEETGLTLSSYRLRSIITFVSDLYGTEYMILYSAKSEKRDLCECDEGELHWIPKDKMFMYPMWEGDRAFLTRMYETDGFFEARLEYQEDKLVSCKFL